MSVDQVFPSTAAGPFGRRQKRARGARAPVTVVTGFLGAGKTTLLRRFLTTPEGQGTAVVVNEFGATGIDDALVRESADETVLLGNGCLCCITRTDLQVALRRMVIERERGEIPDFQRVVIETSGMADPSPDPADLRHRPRARRGVPSRGGADGGGRRDRRRHAGLVGGGAQAGDPGRPAGNHQDRHRRPERRRQARRPTARAQPGRRNHLEAVNGALDPTRLTEPASDERNTFVAEAAHSDGVASFVLTEDKPMPWPVFARAMDVLTTMRGSDLLRVKGFLNVEGCSGPVVVQFVQHLAHPPVELERWPDDNRTTRVVFITRNISERQVRDLFRAINVLI